MSRKEQEEMKRERMIMAMISAGCFILAVILAFIWEVFGV